MILAHFIVNRKILMFYRFYNIEISTTIICELAYRDADKFLARPGRK
jgi:hypothetical protein